MPPTEPDPPSEKFFREGLKAREDGLKIHDNPYAVGSMKRREWNAGFCASTQTEDANDLSVDPDEEAERRAPE